MAATRWQRAAQELACLIAIKVHLEEDAIAVRYRPKVFWRGAIASLGSLLLTCTLLLAVSGSARAGDLPSGAEIKTALEDLHRAHRSKNHGEVYQSGLKHVDASWFGIALATVDGRIYAVGDAERAFPIQSTAKIFSYGLVLDDHGAKAILQRVGVNATGLPYDSLIASEVRVRHHQNPMVSAGAISAMALVKGSSEADKWQRVQKAFADYAGMPLPLSAEIFDYEIGNNTHSLALAYALLTRKLLWTPCDERADDCFQNPTAEQVNAVIARYLKSTSQQVTARRLALMGATLANGGVNPRTQRRAVRRENVPYILSAMVTAGMYDASGQWLSEVGLPAKSGVSGNIVAVVPNRMAIAVYSPPLDARGNSVRGIEVINDLARRWSLHLFAPVDRPG
jgi:glutaminase